MKVERNEWLDKMNNLLARRKSARSYTDKSQNIIADYQKHFEKCELGKSVLDIGCGDMRVKQYCQNYFGIDPFPINKEVKRFEIETFETDETFETVTAFAVLDGVYDLRKAILNMKSLCERNIIILTGIDIEIDEFHTQSINELELNALMLTGDKFNQTYREELTPKVFLLEYSRA